MGGCVELLEWGCVFGQILALHAWVFTKIKVIAFYFVDEFFVWSWSILVFLGIGDLELSFSSESASSNVKGRFEAFAVDGLCWLVSSCFYRFASCIISSMIHIRIIPHHKIRLLKIFVQFFIRNLLFIISRSRNTLHHHWVGPKLKVGLSQFSQLFLIKLLRAPRVMHVVQVRTWDFSRVVVSKLEVRVLEPSGNCWRIHVPDPFFGGVVSLVGCLMGYPLFAEDEMGFSYVLVGRLGRGVDGELFVGRIVHWDEVSGVFAHLEVVGSHSGLSV